MQSWMIQLRSVIDRLSKSAPLSVKPSPLSGSSPLTKPSRHLGGPHPPTSPPNGPTSLPNNETSAVEDPAISNGKLNKRKKSILTPIGRVPSLSLAASPVASSLGLCTPLTDNHSRMLETLTKWLVLAYPLHPLTNSSTACTACRLLLFSVVYETYVFVFENESWMDEDSVNRLQAGLTDAIVLQPPSDVIRTSIVNWTPDSLLEIIAVVGKGDQSSSSQQSINMGTEIWGRVERMTFEPAGEVRESLLTLHARKTSSRSCMYVFLIEYICYMDASSANIRDSQKKLFHLITCAIALLQEFPPTPIILQSLVKSLSSYLHPHNRRCEGKGKPSHQRMAGESANRSKRDNLLLHRSTHVNNGMKNLLKELKAATQATYQRNSNVHLKNEHMSRSLASSFPPYYGLEPVENIIQRNDQRRRRNRAQNAMQFDLHALRIPTMFLSKAEKRNNITSSADGYQTSFDQHLYQNIAPHSKVAVVNDIWVQLDPNPTRLEKRVGVHTYELEGGDPQEITTSTCTGKVVVYKEGLQWVSTEYVDNTVEPPASSKKKKNYESTAGTGTGTDESDASEDSGSDSDANEKPPVAFNSSSTKSGRAHFMSATAYPNQRYATVHGSSQLLVLKQSSRQQLDTRKLTTRASKPSERSHKKHTIHLHFDTVTGIGFGEMKHGKSSEGAFFVSIEYCGQLYKLFPFSQHEARELGRMLAHLSGAELKTDSQYVRSVIEDKLERMRKQVFSAFLEEESPWINHTQPLNSILNDLIKTSRSMRIIDMERLYHSCRLNKLVLKETVESLRSMWSDDEISTDSARVRILTVLERLVDSNTMHSREKIFKDVQTWMKDLESDVDPYKNPTATKLLTELRSRLSSIKAQRLGAIHESQLHDLFADLDLYREFVKEFNFVPSQKRQTKSDEAEILEEQEHEEAEHVERSESNEELNSMQGSTFQHWIASSG